MTSLQRARRAGKNGVPWEVPADLEKVTFSLDQHRVIAPEEDMAFKAMPPIEFLRVAAV